MEDNIIFKKKEDDLNFLKMEDYLKKIVQPKTIKSKKNDCGTAPGNLVLYYFSCSGREEPFWYIFYNELAK